MTKKDYSQELNHLYQHTLYINKSALFKSSKVITKRNLNVTKSDKRIILPCGFTIRSFYKPSQNNMSGRTLSFNSLAGKLIKIHKVKTCPDDKHAGTFKNDWTL